jgi:site-specific DNA recombinase
MRLAGYIRVSKVGGREGDAFISPGVQRERIEAWVEAHGHSLVDTLTDLDEPGSRLERPGLTSAMEQVESGVCRGIVVAKLDRFTRSTAHLGPLLERLRGAGGVLVSVNEGIDTSTATGKLVADIMVAISDWELTRISDNWAVAREAAVSRNIHISGKDPIGYLRGEDRVLVPDPALAGAVQTLFAKRGGGESWARLAGWLTAESGRTYTVGTVRSIIANRVYLGEASGGGGLSKPAAHPPLVSRAQWGAANRVRGVAPSRSGRASGLLSGLLRCSGCRYAMKPSMSTGGGRSRLSYRCKASRSETAGGRCPAPASIEASVVEPLVLERFMAQVAGYRAVAGDDSPQRREAETVLRNAEAELDAALDRRLAEALGGDDAPPYLAAVRQRREAVEHAREALATLSQRASLPDVDFVALWPDLSLYDQRKLLASVFDCVFVRRTPGRGKVAVADRVFVCELGDAPELPVRGRRWTSKPFHWEAASG